jgi:hypothetical protein
MLVAVVGAATAVSSLMAQQDATPRQDVELTQPETELRVKAETARRLGVRADDVRVVESEARTWPDAGLGCNARRGVLEPMPVRGFRITAEANGRRVVYHTDRYGRLLRCSTPAKPIDRIK